MRIFVQAQQLNPAQNLVQNLVQNRRRKRDPKGRPRCREFRYASPAGWSSAR